MPSCVNRPPNPQRPWTRIAFEIADPPEFLAEPMMRWTRGYARLQGRLTLSLPKTRAILPYVSRSWPATNRSGRCESMSNTARSVSAMAIRLSGSGSVPTTTSTRSLANDAWAASHGLDRPAMIGTSRGGAKGAEVVFLSINDFRPLCAVLVLLRLPAKFFPLFGREFYDGA